MSWKFKENIVTEENTPEGAIGFVYKIVHTPTGKFYIGKYYSSNEWIKNEVKEGREGDFEREIIQFCFSKKSLTYWEVWWQFKLDVLADPQSINENLMGKFFRKDIY